MDNLNISIGVLDEPPDALDPLGVSPKFTFLTPAMVSSMSLPGPRDILTVISGSRDAPRGPWFPETFFGSGFSVEPMRVVGVSLEAPFPRPRPRPRPREP